MYRIKNFLIVLIYIVILTGANPTAAQFKPDIASKVAYGDVYLSEYAHFSASSSSSLRTADPPTAISMGSIKTGVPIDVPAYWILIEFDQDMNAKTINNSTFTLLSPDGVSIPGTVIYDTRFATFIPSESLDYSTTYTVRVKGGQNGAQSVAGLPLEGDISWTFLTESLEDMGPLVYHSYKVDDDTSGGSAGNGDSNIDPGETIELKVFMGNQGESTASEVIGIISSSDPSITFTASTESEYNNIIGWGTQPNINDFQFTVNLDTPCGHLIAFDLTVSAAGGYSDIVPFEIPVTCSPPDTPSSPFPAVGEVDVSLDPELSVYVSDPDSDELTVTFYGREITPTTAITFEMIAIPDTQYYTCDGHILSCPNTPFSPYVNDGRITTFISQTEWIVDNKDSIAYAPHVGDMAQNADWYEVEWQRGDSAMDILETGAPEIPWGISFGNHDLRNLYGINPEVTGDTFMNQYFGIDRFQGRPYYAGHFSFNNNSHYILFEVGDLAFIGIHMEYDRDYDNAVIAWADGLLKQYPTRRGIIVRHALIDEVGNFVDNGDRVFDELKENPNLNLMLCGHIDGEFIREDQYNGQTIYTILSDYQSEPNGGDGWLRWFQFSPEEDLITVRSYSTLYDQWDWENPKATGKRELAYDMGYTTREIATTTGVASGSVVTTTWDSLLPDSRYEWYATVSDGTSTTISPLWYFTTTQELTTCNPLTLGYSGSGDPPTASPLNSQGCSIGKYLPGETIDLTAHPADGYHVGSWTGTMNNASTTLNNQAIMPSGEHNVVAHYIADFFLYLPAVYSIDN